MSNSPLEREALNLRIAKGDSSSFSIPRKRDESDLMEDPGIGLLEREQEEILRAVGPFSGRESRAGTTVPASDACGDPRSAAVLLTETAQTANPTKATTPTT